MINRRLFTLPMTVILLLFLHACTETKDDQAEKLCKEEIKKDHPSREYMIKYCIPVADNYQEKNNFSKASQYYLLSGTYEKNLIPTDNNFSSVSTYSTVAHSYVLDTNIKKAEEFYRTFLKNVSISWAGGKIDRDYKLLNKLYPEDKKILRMV